MQYPKILKDTGGKEYRLYFYKATLPAILPKAAAPLFSFSERLKLLLRSVRGYKLFYLMDGEQPCGYVMYKRNYLHRYAFLGRKLLLNPYFICEAYRGRGLATAMLQMTLQSAQMQGSTVYAMILTENLPSIAVVKKLGWEFLGYTEKHGWSHHITQKKTGTVIYKYECRPDFILRERKKSRQDCMGIKSEVP